MTEETAPEAPFTPFGDVASVKRTRFQKIVARTLATNASTIPHVTHHDDADVTGLETYRKTLGADAKVSPLIFLIKAVADALKTFPQFNASLSPDGETLVLKTYINIGIAVDGPLGLLVPVLHDCDRKDIAALAAELGQVSALARAKGLSLDKMSGGGFSISSLGGIGGTYFTPIINAPEVAILGVTGIQTKPVWDGAAFAPRQILPLSLSYDHRVINGGDAARFTRRVAEALTQWNTG